MPCRVGRDHISDVSSSGFLKSRIAAAARAAQALSSETPALRKRDLIGDGTKDLGAPSRRVRCRDQTARRPPNRLDSSLKRPIEGRAATVDTRE
jgi:hypothetical protein